MKYFREYLEVCDDGQPYTVEIRLCHDYVAIPPTDQNQVIVFDERVAELMVADAEVWTRADMPTNTWSVLAC